MFIRPLPCHPICTEEELAAAAEEASKVAASEGSEKVAGEDSETSGEGNSTVDH